MCVTSGAEVPYVKLGEKSFNFWLYVLYFRYKPDMKSYTDCFLVARQTGNHQAESVSTVEITGYQQIFTCSLPNIRHHMIILHPVTSLSLFQINPRRACVTTLM